MNLTFFGGLGCNGTRKNNKVLSVEELPPVAVKLRNPIKMSAI
jgi:hypothetical protein